MSIASKYDVKETARLYGEKMRKLEKEYNRECTKFDKKRYKNSLLAIPKHLLSFDEYRKDL